MQEYDHIVAVLLNLLLLCRLGAALRSTLLDICLERCNLLVYARNVLFYDKSKFLTVVFEDSRKKRKAERVPRTLISTGRSSNNVFRLATAGSP